MDRLPYQYEEYAMVKGLANSFVGPRTIILQYEDKIVVNFYYTDEHSYEVLAPLDYSGAGLVYIPLSEVERYLSEEDYISYLQMQDADEKLLRYARG